MTRTAIMQETRRAKGAETKDALLPSLNASSFEVSSTLLISGSKTVSTKWTMLCIEQRQKDICTVTSTMEKEDTHRGKKASQASQGEQWQKNVCMVTSTTEKKTHTEEKRRVKQVWENNAKKRLHGDKYNGKRRHTQGKNTSQASLGEQRQKNFCTVTSTMEKEDTQGRKASQASLDEQRRENVCTVTSTTEKKTHTQGKKGESSKSGSTTPKKRLHGDKYNGKRRHTQGKKGESSKPGRATPKKLLHGDKYDGKRRQDTHRGERRVKQAWENNRKKTCAR